MKSQIKPGVPYPVIPESAPKREWLTIMEVATALQVTHAALSKWLERRGYLTPEPGRRKTRCPKTGKNRRVPLSVIEEYAQVTKRDTVPTALKRPKGWLGIRQAMEVTGLGCTAIYKAARRGEIGWVRAGQRFFFEPHSAARYRLTFTNDTPLPGWVALLDVAQAQQADHTSALRWLRRCGYPVRMFTRPASRQRVWHTTEEAAASWMAAHASRGRALEASQVLAIRRRRAAGEKRSCLAEEYGVSEALIYQIAQGQAYADVQEAA